jgi:hydrogenase nickel incorporation protein HypA/HybF
VHELSVAISLVEGAEEEAERQGGGRVSAVHLKLGPLSGVVKDALLFSYELACEGTLLAGSRLLIEEIPIRIYCESCASEGDPISFQHLHCARCESENCRVVQGAELELSAMELVT